MWVRCAPATASPSTRNCWSRHWGPSPDSRRSPTRRPPTDAVNQRAARCEPMTKHYGGSRDLEAEPLRGDFAARYRQGKPQVVWTRLVADLETPVSAMLKLGDGAPRPLSCLLESIEGGAARGRYSIIGLAPDVVWRAFGDRAEINRRADLTPDRFEPEAAPTLQSLRNLLAESRIDLPAELPPIAAGVIGYLGHDTVRLIEHLPNQRPDVLGVPDGRFARRRLMAVFDNVKAQIVAVTPARQEV